MPSRRLSLLGATIAATLFFPTIATAASTRTESTKTRVCSNAVERKAKALGYQLPKPFPPAGTYINAVRTGRQLVLGGHIPIDTAGRLTVGKLGADLTVEQGQQAARLAALSALATIREELGSLDRVARVVSVFGVVNATPDFAAQTAVINGASDVFVGLWGKRGQHARLAVGVASLPANLALEITMTVEVAGCHVGSTRRAGAGTAPPPSSPRGIGRPRAGVGP